MRSEPGSAEPIRGEEGIESPRTREGSMPCKTKADCWSSPQSLGVEGGERAQTWTGGAGERECEHIQGARINQLNVADGVLP